jgi:3-oxoadipate enol-lactonase
MSEDQQFTTGDGCKIAYRIDGPTSAPPLMLSNSIATTLHMWDRSVPDLSRTFRVLRYDLRGHGGSGAPVGAYSLDRLGRDVVELIDFLSIERTHFLGLSLGGFVGQWLGVHAPDRIERLILSNTASYLAGELPFDEQIRTVLAAKDMNDSADGFVRNWFPATMRAHKNETVDAFRKMVLTTPPHGLAGNYAALRDVDLRRTISLIKAPTLVIGGLDDTVTRASHSEEIAAAVPNAKLALLPGVHILNVEQPDRFMSEVLGFLGHQQND